MTAQFIFSTRFFLYGLGFIVIMAGGCVSPPPNREAHVLPRQEVITSGFTVISDEDGRWAGAESGAVELLSNMRIQKTVNLAGITQPQFDKLREVRLRVFMSYMSEAKTNQPPPDSFTIELNGHCHPGRYDRRFPLEFAWHDFIIPVKELAAAENRIVFKTTGALPDGDHIRIGIDDSVSHGNSLISTNSGETWRPLGEDSSGPRGEYMIRAVLIENDLSRKAGWRPASWYERDDPDKLIAHVKGFGGKKGKHGGSEIGPGQRIDISFNFNYIDRSSPFYARIRFEGENSPILRWYAEDGSSLDADNRVEGNVVVSVPRFGRARPSVLQLHPPKNGFVELHELMIHYVNAYLPPDIDIDMCPAISPARGSPSDREPQCTVTGDTIILQNAYYRYAIERTPSLCLKSFEPAYLAKNVLNQAVETAFFLIEVKGQRYRAQDFEIREVKSLPSSNPGVQINLFLPACSVGAVLTLSVDKSPEMRMALTLTNEGPAPLQFKTAFPHLGGLVLSDNETRDYYCFPWYGGVIADVPAHLRAIYGENNSWWQMMDAFSPERGGGIYVRCDDSTGLWKAFTLRKSITPRFSDIRMPRGMNPDVYWTNSLEAGAGISMAVEYLRVMRRPNETFTLPDAVIGVHAGDWHAAMEQYSIWAHRTWQWRPFPSTLADVWKIDTRGWNPPLYFNGQYQINPRNQKEEDLVELFGWWQWGDRGPWNVPLDKESLKKNLGNHGTELVAGLTTGGALKFDPITGKLRYDFNVGDYEYNQDWGGLPALRGYIDKFKHAGKKVTLYLEGLKLCATSRAGKEHGAEHGVINPYVAGKQDILDMTSKDYIPAAPRGYVGMYAYDPCSDSDWWPGFLAEKIRRICLDTGVDGVRIDEYGCGGIPCYSDKHRHIYAEPEHNATLQAQSAALRGVRAAMDEIRPDLTLMTEYVSADHLARYLDGALVTQKYFRSPICPIPICLFRFYFPECKLYDLEPLNGERVLWNAMGIYGGNPVKNQEQYETILRENGDVFSTGKAEPLVFGLRKRVYVNRFASKNKTLYLFINDNPYPVEEALVEAPLAGQCHFFDLVRCEEAQADTGGDVAVIGIPIPIGMVGCVAQLPRLLKKARCDDGSLAVTIAAAGKDLRLALVSADGKIIIEAPAGKGKNCIDLGNISKAQPSPACIKLLRGKYLLDAIAMPGLLKDTEDSHKEAQNTQGKKDER